MDIYISAVSQIIKQQAAVIGPLAMDQARKVSGLEVLSENEVRIKGNGKQVLEKLVETYSRLFGQASIEVCKDAIKEINPPIKTEDLPQILL